ncbi:MAG: NYN domain-containing protein [Candidatus Thorarchaeota archaeon]
MSSRPGRIRSLVRLVTRLRRSGRVALLIDGPNVLRREFDVRLDDLKNEIEELGKIGVAKVYLNERASPKLLEAISNSGFTPVVSTTDIHIHMTVDSMDLVLGDATKLLVIFSRHARVASILRKAREHGVETVAIGFEPGFSVAVQNAADHVLRLDKPLENQLLKIKGKKKKKKKEDEDDDDWELDT